MCSVHYSVHDVYRQLLFYSVSSIYAMQNINHSIPKADHKLAVGILFDENARLISTAVSFILSLFLIYLFHY